MALYVDHAALSPLQTQLFRYGPHMWATDMVKIYHNLPVRLGAGKQAKIAVTKYISGEDGDRRKAAKALRRRLLDSSVAAEDANVRSWLEMGEARIRKAHAGHGLPEEISLLCELAVKAGEVSEGMLAKWAAERFGLDCNGFANAYFTCLGCFQQPIHYHNKYRQIAGTAYDWSELCYDNAVLWAWHKGKWVTKKDAQGNTIDANNDKKPDRERIEFDPWEVRPNPGNKAHIAVVDHCVGTDKLVICQQGSDVGPRVNEYEIVSKPKARNKDYAVWRIRVQGGSAEDVIFTRIMPSYVAGA